MLPDRTYDGGKSHFDAAPVYLYFTNRFQKKRNTLGLSEQLVSCRLGQEEKKLPHRESPMSRARTERKQKKKRRKKGKFGNIIKSRRTNSTPPFFTVRPHIVSLVSKHRDTDRTGLSWWNSLYVNTLSTIYWRTRTCHLLHLPLCSVKRDTYQRIEKGRNKAT